MPPPTLTNAPFDPFSIPPLTLTNALFIDFFSMPPLSPHRSIPPLTLTNAHWHWPSRPHWPWPTPPLTLSILALSLTNAPFDPFSIPALTLTNALFIDFFSMPPLSPHCSIPPLTLTNAHPFQYPHWPSRPHWPWPTPPLTLFNTPIDPDQCPHWRFSIPPLTLTNAPIDPFQCHHWPFLHAPNALIDPTQYPRRILCNWIFDTTIENVQRPDWNFTLKPNQSIRLDTPPIRLDTPQIRLDTPQIRLDTPQIRLNTTLNDKSNWIRTKFDWIRPLPPPKALNSRHWGFTGVQAVCHEKHMQQYQLTQQNLNQIKTEKLQRHLKKLRESM